MSVVSGRAAASAVMLIDLPERYRCAAYFCQNPNVGVRRADVDESPWCRCDKSAHWPCSSRDSPGRWGLFRRSGEPFVDEISTADGTKASVSVGHSYPQSICDVQQNLTQRSAARRRTSEACAVPHSRGTHCLLTVLHLLPPTKIVLLRSLRLGMQRCWNDSLRCSMHAPVLRSDAGSLATPVPLRGPDGVFIGSATGFEFAFEFERGEAPWLTSAPLFGSLVRGRVVQRPGRCGEAITDTDQHLYSMAHGTEFPSRHADVVKTACSVRECRSWDLDLMQSLVAVNGRPSAITLPRDALLFPSQTPPT